MTQFFNPYWADVLQQNGLANFDSLWQLKTPWFEEPNIRRGGWSGVTRVELETEHGPANLFIKRQENHISRTFRHPIKGVATFEKEFANLKRFHRFAIPTLNLVYYASREQNNNRQAILVTEALDGYQSLDDEQLDFYTMASHDRKKLLATIAAIAQKMHQRRLQHNCFYPKHIFVKRDGDNWSIRIIDLEKTKHTLSRRIAMLRDLSTLSRHSPNISVRDQLYFLKAYQGEKNLSHSTKRLFQQIQHKISSKNKNYLTRNTT